MNVKHSLLVGATLATVTLGGGGLAMAATNTTSTSGDTLVDKIAAKFNLNKSDVQAVFDANRAEHRADMQADQKERLATAVKAGKLTQAQADHIQSVRDEIDKLIGDSNPRDVSSTMRDQIKAKMDELHTWADEQNIDDKYVMDGPGGHGHGGFGGRNDKADDADDSASSSSSSSSSTN